MKKKRCCVVLNECQFIRYAVPKCYNFYAMIQTLVVDLLTHKSNSSFINLKAKISRKLLNIQLLPLAFLFEFMQLKIMLLRCGLLHCSVKYILIFPIGINKTMLLMIISVLRINLANLKNHFKSVYFQQRRTKFCRLFFILVFFYFIPYVLSRFYF